MDTEDMLQITREHYDYILSQAKMVSVERRDLNLNMNKEAISFLRDYIGAPPEDDDLVAQDYFALALIKALGLPPHGRKLKIEIGWPHDPIVTYEYNLKPDDPLLRGVIEKCALFEVKMREGAVPPPA